MKVYIVASHFCEGELKIFGTFPTRELAEATILNSDDCRVYETEVFNSHSDWFAVEEVKNYLNTHAQFTQDQLKAREAALSRISKDIRNPHRHELLIKASEDVNYWRRVFHNLIDIYNRIGFNFPWRSGVASD